jgi:polyhydroxyalkanoate synthesis regulator phasin
MSNEFIEPWQKMMSEWQKTQTTVTQQMMDNMQKWNGANASAKTDNSYYSNNPTLDIYQSFIQKIFDHNPQYNLQSSNDWHEILSAFPGSDTLMKQMSDVIQGSKGIFDQLKEDFIKSLPEDETRDYFLKTLEDISNPYSWVKFSSTDFDEGVKRFSEGPLFSGVSDIDNRVAKAMDGWLELGEKNNDYYEVLLKNWITAYEKFLEQLKDSEDVDMASLSPKKMVELWSSIANDELMKMHRSEEFLESQKALIKASAEYRLHEQDIAEVICNTLHIPTRKEIDDVHKTITELRREVRALKNTIAKQETPKTSKKKAATKKG